MLVVDELLLQSISQPTRGQNDVCVVAVFTLSLGLVTTPSLFLGDGRAQKWLKSKKERKKGR